MNRLWLFFCLLCLPWAARGQSAYDWIYWFDSDDTQKHVGTSQGDAFSIIADADGLEKGFHTIHMQVADTAGRYSPPLTKMFFYADNNLNSMHYWFDDDKEMVQTFNSLGETVMIDVSELSDGFHTIHIQFGESNSGIVSQRFIKVPQTEGDGQMTVICTVDEKIVAQHKVASTGGVISWQMPVESIDVGLHQAVFQAITSTGAASTIAERYFIRVISDKEMQGMKCVYSVDNQQTFTQTGSMTSGGKFHFDLDVSSLDDGLHRLAYTMVSEKGVTTPQKTAFFWKTPLGGTGIVQYDYWLNDDTENMRSTKLGARENPFRLISLLPVDTHPIRSSCFHFEVKDGQPVIYAKNDFHIRFFDTSSREVNETKQYVDYQVRQDVTDVTPLESGVRVTMEKPEENVIRWYSMQAAPGDTVAFRVSQAATVQVFSPSGKEVFKTSEAASVQWGGIHTWEEGTYYVAVHDVTGSRNNMTLDYMHMDKYDVVEWDVHTVGNGGCSTITFEGNGFRDLYAVDLYNEKGDTIHSAAVGFICDAEVSVTFDFVNSQIGEYDAIFRFTDENKRYRNIVTVEQAKDIELELSVKYPGTFVSGTSTTYTITVTNKGNATAYNVPMEIYLSAGRSFTNIQSVKFKDEHGKAFNNFSLDEIDKDSIDDETMDYLKDILQELNGLQSFIVKNDSADGGEYGFTDQLITIPPNSSTTFYIEVKSSSSVELNVRIPSDWMTVYSASELAETRSLKKSASDSKWCCEKEKWECGVRMFADFIGTITAFSGNPIISSLGCISDIVDLGVYSTFEIACANGETIGEKLKSFGNSNKLTTAVSKFGSTILSCVTFGLGRFISKWAGELKTVKNNCSSAWSSMNKNKKLADEYAKKHSVALKKFDEAVMSGDMDLATSYLKEAENAEKTEKLYLEWVERDYQKALQYNEQALSLEKKIDEPKTLLANFINSVKNGISLIQGSSPCYKEWTRKTNNCPRNPRKGGGPSSPVNSYDPNDIFGYTAESGSKAVKDGQQDVYYTIEFENDPEFATAPAHDIYLTNTLDATKFDLSTFAPTRVKIGDKSAELTGEKNFVTTIDMRPSINAIAQVEGTYDQQKGIAKWHISSLDPMTMEPTTYLMDGVLPVNNDGRGIGEVWYDIKLKQNLAHGTEIDNRAAIVFDNNDVIMTPTWTNVIDRITPESHVTDVQMMNDSTAAVSIAATDELSGPWCYNVYVQYGDGAWFLGAENVPIDKTANVKVYQGIDHGFYVVVTDSAGNVEQKEAQREYTFEVFAPQVETTTKLQLAEGWNWISQNQNTPLSTEALKPKAQRILSQTEELYKDARFGWTGDLNELQPTQMYKVQTNGNGEIQLSGLLFNAAFRSVPLYEGWNWLGYPVAHTMTPTEALAKLEAEEGDALIGQDGLATFNDGQWTGTLTELVPGQGYLYRSTSTKNLFLNATAQASRRMVNQQKTIGNTDTPETWTVDKRKYPNIMGIVASLCQNGEPVADADEWLLGAFSGGECRGLAQTVGGQLMMNVYGQGGEAISFFVMHRETGEILAVSENMTFCTDLIGTVRQPFILNMSVLTGITDAQRDGRLNADHVYDLQGRRVDGNHGGKGVYIVTDENHSRTQKAVRR